MQLTCTAIPRRPRPWLGDGVIYMFFLFLLFLLSFCVASPFGRWLFTWTGVDCCYSRISSLRASEVIQLENVLFMNLYGISFEPRFISASMLFIAASVHDAVNRHTQKRLQNTRPCIHGLFIAVCDDCRACDVVCADNARQFIHQTHTHTHKCILSKLLCFTTIMVAWLVRVKRSWELFASTRNSVTAQKRCEQAFTHIVRIVGLFLVTAATQPRSRRPVRHRHFNFTLLLVLLIKCAVCVRKCYVVIKSAADEQFHKFWYVFVCCAINMKRPRWLAANPFRHGGRQVCRLLLCSRRTIALTLQQLCRAQLRRRKKCLLMKLANRS